MPSTYTPVPKAVWLSHLQKGNGLGRYAGDRYQRGSGLGAVFGSLLRTIIPLSNSAGKKPAFSFAIGKTKAARKPRKQPAKDKTQEGKGFGIRPTTTPRVAGGPLKTIKRITKPKKATGRKKKTDAFGSSSGLFS